MIHFVCGGCQSRLETGNEWAGKLGNCPLCGTDTSVPIPNRTSKTTVLGRLVAVPILVVGFWAVFLGSLALPFILGGLAALGLGLLFWWAFTNAVTYLLCPDDYKRWKASGGDTFFDTLCPPFNNDAEATRYQTKVDQ